jgi:RNA recognition motif-containing protein
METKLYIGNLPYSATEKELRDLFSQAGEVSEVVLIKDRNSGRSKGFAFVTMSNQSEVEKAIQMFNEQDLGGRALKVSIARPKEEGRDRRGGGGGGGRDRSGGGRRDNRGGGGRRERRDDFGDY